VSRLWELPVDQRPVEDLLALANLVAGHSLLRPARLSRWMRQRSVICGHVWRLSILRSFVARSMATPRRRYRS
jgi:hypothetical protein